MMLISLYWITHNPLFKALPCLFLYMVTNHPAFIFTAAGDYLLEADYFMLGLYSFSISNILLNPKCIPDINAVKLFLVFQPAIIYTFGWQTPFVDLYVCTLVNLLTTHTIQAYMYVMSDIFVLSQYMGYPEMSIIALPLYWGSMYLYSRESTSIENRIER